MMPSRLLAVSALALALVVGGLYAADVLKSGPQKGDKITKPFEPLNINGPTAGEKKCLVCRNGENPVVMVFARGTSEPLTNLIKKLDKVTAENTKAKMGSFVVFLNEDEAFEKQLKEMAKKADLKETVLSTYDTNGVPEYNVSKEADVTVVIYNDRDVKANYAFKKGEMKDKDVEKIIGDVSLIVPKK